MTQSGRNLWNIRNWRSRSSYTSHSQLVILQNVHTEFIITGPALISNKRGIHKWGCLQKRTVVQLMMLVRVRSTLQHMVQLLHQDTYPPEISLFTMERPTWPPKTPLIMNSGHISFQPTFILNNQSYSAFGSVDWWFLKKHVCNICSCSYIGLWSSNFMYGRL